MIYMNRPSRRAATSIQQCPIIHLYHFALALAYHVDGSRKAS